MANRNSGTEYEALVHRIYSAILHHTPNARVVIDEKVTGADGPRQVDVAIYHTLAGVEYLTAVECRDFATRIDIKQIDGFCSKLTDIKAAKGIIVTRHGYSKNAARKAARVGITLLIADQANKVKLDEFQAIPIILCRINVEAVGPCFRLGSSVPKSLAFKDGLPINGISSAEILLEAYRRNLLCDIRGDNEIFAITDKLYSRARMFNAFVDLSSYFAGEPVWVEDSSGQKHIIEDARLLFKLKYTWHFGHVSDMKSALQMVDAQTKMTHIVFSLREINELPMSLVSIRSPDEAPPYAKGYGLRVFSVDTLEPFEETSVEVYRYS